MSQSKQPSDHAPGSHGADDELSEEALASVSGGVLAPEIQPTGETALASKVIVRGWDATKKG